MAKSQSPTFLPRPIPKGISDVKKIVAEFQGMHVSHA